MDDIKIRMLQNVCPEILFMAKAAPGWILDIWKGRKEAKLLEYQSKLFKMPTKW